MPRPPDNYTHSQFELIESEHQGDTVQCVHCRNWTGSVKTLNRKKAHLLNCPQYAQWREQGNGQDLAPPNKYQKRDSSTLNAWDRGDESAINPYLQSSPFNDGPSYTPQMNVRGRNLDTTKYFDEFWDDSSAQKCMRVRCLSCGYVRAKNTTRQVEHLAQCQSFLNSTEGQAALAAGEIEFTPAQGRSSYGGGNDIWRGGAPNPNLQVGSGSQSRSVAGNLGASQRMPPPGRQAPSLVSHLLNKWPEKLQKATQQKFLSHAGCGTLSAGALSNWLGQNSHISRAMIGFIGSLIGKVRLPEHSPNSKFNTQYRALDLLISTVSNLRKEIDFIENTKRKYALQNDGEPPSPITKAYVDLLASAASAHSSLLEGMVALWVTEHCYYASWQYASTFSSTVPSSNYSVPSYLTGGMDPYGGSSISRPGNSSDQHISALQEALIPNWTSREFSKFVDACKAIVDELANAETTGSGREQLTRCESQYQQIIFLWERIWPEVDGLGEEEDLADGDHDTSHTAGRPQSGAGPSGTNGNSANKSDPIEIGDDDDDDDGADGNDDAPMDSVDSPYGGTGLGAVHAANQAV
ncbi:hypothetical protein PRZ48_005249 [Zasmidium cellare]|uniref:Heme oxygenase n=1 Tax=Zasmidium cellare TaxID=395010 RepID=A0ABR0ET32_ZASCE|nr:hypothetical protein PRZ48_005249 [Zasmidium cellare]